MGPENTLEMFQANKKKPFADACGGVRGRLYYPLWLPRRTSHLSPMRSAPH